MNALPLSPSVAGRDSPVASLEATLLDDLLTELDMLASDVRRFVYLPRVVDRARRFRVALRTLDVALADSPSVDGRLEALRAFREAGFVVLDSLREQHRQALADRDSTVAIWSRQALDRVAAAVAVVERRVVFLGVSFA